MPILQHLQLQGAYSPLNLSPGLVYCKLLRLLNSPTLAAVQLGGKKGLSSFAWKKGAEAMVIGSLGGTWWSCWADVFRAPVPSPLFLAQTVGIMATVGG